MSSADLLAQDLDVRAALADDDPRLGRVDRDRDVVDAALDLDAGHARVGQPPLDELADRDVLLDEGGVFLVRIPLRGPGARDTQAEAVRMDLATHSSGLLIRDDDRDVGLALVDRERPTLGPGLPALERRTLVGVGLDDDEVLGRQVVVVLGVGRGALQHLPRCPERRAAA